LSGVFLRRGLELPVKQLAGARQLPGQQGRQTDRRVAAQEGRGRSPRASGRFGKSPPIPLQPGWLYPQGARLRRSRFGGRAEEIAEWILHQLYCTAATRDTDR